MEMSCLVVIGAEDGAGSIYKIAQAAIPGSGLSLQHPLPRLDHEDYPEHRGCSQHNRRARRDVEIITEIQPNDR